MNPRIYFDHSATTPLDPRVLAAMGPFLGGAFGNPSSLHREGRVARQAVETARAQVASLIGAEPNEIIFTASGTEADNLALVGAVRAGDKPGHVVTSSVEHAAILETCRFLAEGEPSQEQRSLVFLSMLKGLSVRRACCVRCGRTSSWSPSWRRTTWWERFSLSRNSLT